MLSYKGNQSVKPSYSFYAETDIDVPDDQLVDWSKRYADHDSEELCCSSSEKKQHHSTVSVNSVVNKQSDDELKRYYTEGTPTIASYSSSLNDLREVGISEPSSSALILKEQSRKEHGFSPSHNFSIGTPGSPKNCINSKLVINENHASVQLRKIESNKEEECINQETEATYTKASSPLMFSRSSSVGSLNSFEQHSIVDDRSSVSAFSNLASGIISPSEIPDSPGEVASPFIPKSKNNEFLFPINDKPMDPVLAKDNPNGDFTDEAFEDFLEDDIKVYNDEGDCPSVSNLSALSIQANSTRLSISVIQCKNALVSLTQKSSVTVNCSVADRDVDFNAFCSVLPCIKTTNQNEKVQNNIETKYEDKGTSTSEDFNFHDVSYERCSSPLKDKPTDLAYLQQNESAEYSKDNSDDEYDESAALIEECILSGKPSKDILTPNISKQSLNNSFQTSGSSLKDCMDVPNCSFSDNDISDDEDDDNDEDNGMVTECVLLGLLNKPNNTQFKTEKSSILKVSSDSITSNNLPISSSPNHQSKLFDDTYHSVMLSEVQQSNQDSYKENLDLVLTEAVSSQRGVLKEENLSPFNMISHSNNQDDIEKEAVKSDDESDIDENYMLVQQCIKLGMPTGESENPKNTKETKLPVVFPPSNDLGYRDNYPDGVSDGEDDDDDDILKAVVKAGKPESNSETNKKKQNKFAAYHDREKYLKDFGMIPKNNVLSACASANSLICVDDSTCEYRTEDTPLLSPTLSISDLSSLSFTEDKNCQESFLNNSRNSDCSSESEDDELVEQCIRSGMPEARREGS